jgi:colanic acid/amylovoran biosynthesis protein
MGIPAIGIAHSEYYRQKFNGLASLFGGGCVVVDAAETEADTELDGHFDRLWNDAPSLRDLLLRAATEQLGKGRAAYDALAKLQRSHSSAPF